MTLTGLVRGNDTEGAGRNGADSNGNGAGGHGGAEGVAVGYLRSVPDLASPFRRKKASFSHAALAYLFGREGRDPDGDAIPQGEKRLCREQFPVLLEAYERRHGQICKSFFAQHAFVAAVITDEDEVEIVWSRQESRRNPAEVKLLFRCDELSYAAYHRLHQYDRRHCQQMIFSVVLELLRRIDRQRREAAPDLRAEQLAELEKRLDEAEDFMLRSATRRAQSHYLKGMLAGTGAVLAGVGLLGWLLSSLSLTGSENADAVLALSAGALGALISVLMRMTSGQFSMNLPVLNSEMHKTDLHLIAAARPVIGAVSGVIAYALVRSSLVPIEAAGSEDPTFMWMSIAFLAGFSERLAQDMFARSGRGLQGPAGEEPTSGPAAGLGQAVSASR